VPGSVYTDNTNFAGSGYFTNNLSLAGNAVKTNRTGIWRTHYIDAGACATNPATGASPKTDMNSVNLLPVDYLEFGESISNTCSFKLNLGNTWDLGAIKLAAWWGSTNTTANVTNVWEFSAVCVPPGTTNDTALGTAVQAASKLSGANTNSLSTAVSVTPGGTAATNALTYVLVRRLPAESLDNLGGVSKLRGVWLYYKESEVEPGAP
jgi:hypothetical protein